MSPIPELLAPAGSIETFWAAHEAGADAFYLGAAEFNARRRAKNFTPDELRDAVLCAHRHKKRVYCTLNTLVFDKEIPRVTGLLETLEEIAIDAVIVQDLGLIRLISRHFPSIRMHASTQMFCHNSQQAQFLKDLGIKRIVFPRELTVEEMRTIIDKVPLEYEAFIHGAMCFSFSGCCLFSSHLFGASGNRGECRQPCRYSLEVEGQSQYPFSMRDLRTTSVLGDILAKVPLTSLKIEGRLKSAAYVGDTVVAYRRILDALHDGKPVPETDDVIAGQRSTTSGYFFGGSYETLVDRNAPGTIGETVGQVLSASGTCLEIRLTQPVGKGDRLNLQTADGKRVYEGTLLDFSRSGDGMLQWTVKDEIRSVRIALKGLSVVRTGNSAPENPRREMHKDASMVKTVPLSIALLVDAATSQVRVEAKFGASGETYAQDYPLQLRPDPQLRWREGAVETIFRQVDTTPFDVRDVSLVPPDGVWCRLSEVKAVRRRFYAELLLRHSEIRARFVNARTTAVLGELSGIQEALRSSSGKRMFRFVSGPDADLGSDGAEFDVVECVLSELPGPPPSDRIVVLLPLFVSQENVAAWRQWIAALVRQGYRRFMVPTYGWIPVLRALGVREVIAGSYLYAVNSFAVDLLSELGVENFTISPDMAAQDLGPITEFRGAVYPVNPRAEMLVTRLDLPDKRYRMKNRTYRVRRCGEFSVVTRDS